VYRIAYFQLEYPKTVHRIADLTLKNSKNVHRIADLTLKNSKNVHQLSPFPLESSKTVHRIADLTLEVPKTVHKIADLTLEVPKTIDVFSADNSSHVLSLKDAIRDKAYSATKSYIKLCLNSEDESRIAAAERVMTTIRRTVIEIGDPLKSGAVNESTILESLVRNLELPIF
jgi:hypothetical protein